MRALVQRVSEARVTVEGREVGAIGPGCCVLVGVTHTDTADDARRLAEKVWRLRIFADEAGAMNRSAEDLGFAVLVVSQFTLYADTRKGRRPAFVDAAAPEHASTLVDGFCAHLRALGATVASGEFGAHMEVALVNDGPVTILLEVPAPSR